MHGLTLGVAVQAVDELLVEAGRPRLVEALVDTTDELGERQPVRRPSRQARTSPSRLTYLRSSRNAATARRGRPASDSRAARSSQRFDQSSVCRYGSTSV
jgi:hypothetical protein